MKKIFTVLIAISLIAAIPALLSSCGDNTGGEAVTDAVETVPAEEQTTEAQEPTAADVTVVYEPRIFTQRDAHDLFQEFYSQGHHEFIEQVGISAADMKEKAAGVYDEIIVLLDGLCEKNTEYFSRTAEENHEKFVAPFEEYYKSRLESAQTEIDAYAGIGALESMGGTAGADAGPLAEYVYYRNLYDELVALRDSLPIYD